ncbi:MAG: hypothetical protein CMQ88_01905, partial [Gammaproteobacteria bacterium]|nr:hypothetical protein [Gammaproteobacteria bacterium]
MCYITSNFKNFLLNSAQIISSFAKVVFATVLLGSFSISAQASTTIGESSSFAAGPNDTWVKVITLTTVADGADSQGEQTLSMNVTALPDDGANYRVFRTTANGGSFQGNAVALSLGANDISVGGVSFDRAVKIQFSSADVAYDSLSVNGASLYTAPPAGEPPAGITIDENSSFAEGPNDTWVKVITLALASDGASSQAAQALSMNVTELPLGGATYRVYKTTANGSDFFGNAVALTLGANVITVPVVAFDRAVKIQFSSADVRFDTISVNGDQLYPVVSENPDNVISVADSQAFSVGPNETWVKLITLALASDGDSSQGAQTLSMNIIGLPADGAEYRVYKTTANGSDFFGNPVALTLGANNITIGGVAFDRTVKIQLSSSEITFDALSVNENQLHPSTTLGVTLGESDAFYDKDHATWVKVIDLALVADGVSSQGAQSLSMNVTELPEGGADYRVYKTTANGSDFFGDAVALTLGENNITVGGVAFDRTVKLQFSSADIRFDALLVNGGQLYPVDPVGPSFGTNEVSITEAFGGTVISADGSTFTFPASAQAWG